MDQSVAIRLPREGEPHCPQQFQHEPVEEVSYLYTCAACYALIHNVCLSEGVSTILNQRVRWERQRTTGFKANVEAARQEWGMVCSSRQIKTIARSSLVKMFEPWRLLIKAKAAQIELQDLSRNRQKRFLYAASCSECNRSASIV
jgi:hypothetical protein